MRMLYPYDGTVFPRGMLAPTVDVGRRRGRRRVPAHQVAAVRVQGLPEADRARSAACCRRMCGTKPAQQTMGSGDPYTVELTRDERRHGHGPVAEHVDDRASHAQGLDLLQQLQLDAAGRADAGRRMALIGGPGWRRWAASVLRIPPGGKAEGFLSTRLQRLPLGVGERLAPDQPARSATAATSYRARRRTARRTRRR